MFRREFRRRKVVESGILYRGPGYGQRKEEGAPPVVPKLAFFESLK